MMETKCAFVTLIGRPNVGKSTLLNALIGQKVSIVSPKPQTTRRKVTGVLTEGDTQLVFFDTPGLHKAKNKLGVYMDDIAEQSADGADIVVMVVESGDEVRPAERRMTGLLTGKKNILVINKIDLRPKEDILSTIAAFREIFPFDEIIPVSAYKKDGVDILKTVLKNAARPSPFFYDGDAVTDMSEQEMICETAREKMLYLLGEEVPHGIAVSLSFLEKKSDIVRVGIDIVCERDAHKAIIIGKGGQKLREIGAAVRRELEFIYDGKVYLECFVKVRKDWRNDIRSLATFGFSE